jgi:hypothetical protein
MFVAKTANPAMNNVLLLLWVDMVGSPFPGRVVCPILCYHLFESFRGAAMPIT